MVAALGFLLLASAAFAQLRMPAMLIIAGHTGGNHSAGQGYLGVDLRDVTSEQINTLRLKEARGAEIIRVDHDGPAGKAGLREHDVVLSVNLVGFDGEAQLRKLLRDMLPGHSVSLLISRDGALQTISTVLANRDELGKRAWEQHWVVPEPQNAIQDSSVPMDSPSSPHGFAHGFVSGHLLPTGAYTGAVVDAIGPQLADFFGMKDGKGLLVHGVDLNSPAASAGLHAGDVITRVNGKVVATRTDWMKSLHDSKGHPVSVTVMRDRHEQTLTMIPDAKHRSCVEPATGERRSMLAMLLGRPHIQGGRAPL